MKKKKTKVIYKIRIAKIILLCKKFFFDHFFLHLYYENYIDIKTLSSLLTTLRESIYFDSDYIFDGTYITWSSSRWECTDGGCTK